MMINKWVLALALLVTTGQTIAQEQAAIVIQGQAESLMTMRVDGEIAIDAQGKVLDYSLGTSLQPELQQLVAKAVPTWSFWPVVIDGKPVAAKTRMRITLAARTVEGGYAIKVDNVTFRDEELLATNAVAQAAYEVAISAKSMRPPGYPKGLLKAHAEGMVLLILKLTPQGEVESVLARQSSLFNIKGRPETMDAALELLEDNATTAAKRWSFKVDTHGQPIQAADLMVAVPVVYRLTSGSSSAPGQWRHEVRGLQRDLPWANDDGERIAQNIGVSDFDSGEIVQYTTSFRLREGIVGKAL